MSDRTFGDVIVPVDPQTIRLLPYQGSFRRPQHRPAVVAASPRQGRRRSRARRAPPPCARLPGGRRRRRRARERGGGRGLRLRRRGEHGRRVRPRARRRARRAARPLDARARPGPSRSRRRPITACTALAQTDGPAYSCVCRGVFGWGAAQSCSLAGLRLRSPPTHTHMHAYHNPKCCWRFPMIC